MADRDRLYFGGSAGRQFEMSTEMLAYALITVFAIYLFAYIFSIDEE